MEPFILPGRVSQQHIQVQLQASSFSGLEGALLFFLFPVVVIAPA